MRERVITVENIEVNGETALIEQILHLPGCFKTSSAVESESVYVGKG